VAFVIAKYLRLVSLLEDYDTNSGIMVNPTKAEKIKFFQQYDVARMLVDTDGNIVVWDAYRDTHDAIRRRMNIATSASSPLSQLSMYAWNDVLGVRMYEVGDEEVHPKYTDLARTNPNLTLAWGPTVTVIDIHGEP